MSKVFSGIGNKLFGHGPGAPAPLPPDDTVAKMEAQANASRVALADRKAAGRSSTQSAGTAIAFDEQQNLMAKKVQRTAASQDLMG